MLQHIILVEFGAQPFRLEEVFRLVSFLHWIRGLADSSKGRDRYPFLAYYSAQTIFRDTHPGRTKCWLTEVSDLLASVGIQLDRLPPFQYSLDAPGHLLPVRQELNKIIREDIYKQFI